MSKCRPSTRHRIEGAPAASHNSKGPVMNYTLLFYQTPSDFAARTDPKKREAFWAGFLPYMKALQEAGVVVAGAGLQPPESATTLKLRDDGTRAVQDGPFADTK